MRLFILIGIVLLLLVSGCGYKQGVSTGDAKAYLYFTGDTTGVTVSINNSAQFTVKSGRDNQYEIEPGKHTVRAYRDGALIVERDIYVGDGIAKEIGVN